MPLRDFQCAKCGSKQERLFYSPSASAVMICEQPTGSKGKKCGGRMKLLERSQEGPGHVVSVRIK